MSTLLRFLIRFATHFEFLALEAVALLFVFNSGAFRQSALFRFNTTIVAAIYETGNTCASYFRLKTENQYLAEENEALLNRIAMLEKQIDDAPAADLVADYQTIAAKVIYSTVNRAQNTLILDKGSRDGVAVDMGVVNAEGVIGVVDAVSTHYAVVIPIINTNLQISGKIAKNGYLGSVNWDGISPTYATLSDIPHHIEAARGDTVVTSGYSAIFATGIPIGVIDTVIINNNQTFSRIRLRLAANFRTVDRVHIIDAANREELTQLVDSVQHQKH